VGGGGFDTSMFTSEVEFELRGLSLFRVLVAPPLVFEIGLEVEALFTLLVDGLRGVSFEFVRFDSLYLFGVNSSLALFIPLFPLITR